MDREDNVALNYVLCLLNLLVLIYRGSKYKE